MTGRTRLLLLTAVLSFCSLVYEMTIAACFVAFTGDSPFWQSLTIGLYLAAVGLGTWTCSRWVKGDAWRALWRVELALTAAGAACAIGVLSVETALRIRQHFFQPTMKIETATALLAVSTGHLFTLVIGWLSGFEIPLLMRLMRESDRSGVDRDQEVLGANYLGGLLGTLAFSFWLLPRLGVTGSGAAASALNLAVCAQLYRERFRSTPGLARPALAAAGAAWALLTVLGPTAATLNAVAFYASRLGIPGSVMEETCCAKRYPGLGQVIEGLWERRADVERYPSRLQRIDLVSRTHERGPEEDYYNRRPMVETELPYGLTLYLDRRYQFYGGSEALYHEFLTHVPIQMFRRVPRDVLILGGGDGLLAKELLKYGDQIRRIVNVELDPSMVALARQDPRFRLLNRDSFRQPKVEIVVTDAFGYIRDTADRFDAVFMDFPFPYTYDAAKLYTKEFFRNVSTLLKPGGFVAMDYPLASQEMQDEENDPENLRRNSIAVNTIRAGGFRTIVPFSTECIELLPRGDAMLMQGVPQDPEDDQELGVLTRRIAARRFMLRNPGAKFDETEDLVVVKNRISTETMLAFTVDRTEPNFEFQDHGIPLYSLNARRLKLLEGGQFPYEDDKRLINTMARPTLFRSLQFISGG